MPTVNLFFDTRATANDEGIIKLLITHKRKQRLYTTGIKTTADLWSSLPKKGEPLDGRIKDEERIELYQKIYQRPNGFYRRAEKILAELGVNFDFDAFKEKFENWGKEVKITDDRNNVFAAIIAKANAMRKETRIGNAIQYELTAKSLRRYYQSLDNATRKDLKLPPLPPAKKRLEPPPLPTLRFEHITPDFLTDYEHWATKYGKSPQTSNPKKGNTKATGASITTVGIYLRHLRAVINDAIENGILAREKYPFGRNRYIIPQGKNIKKALTKEDIIKIMQYECSNDFEQRARDLWIFSYLSNGINFADICALRWKDLDRQSNTLHFIRQKTARSTKSNQTPIEARLFAESWAIIERQGNPDQRPDAYVFPFLDDTMTPEKKYSTALQVVHITNKYMKRIGQKLGLPLLPTTYAARHSFATIMLQSGAPVAYISQAMGHTTIQTTQSYLDTLQVAKAKNYLDALI